MSVLPPDTQESPANSREHALVFLLILAGAVFGCALVSMLGGLLADENAHAPQIWTFYSGGTSVTKLLTMPPTYHYIMAFIVRQIGYYSDPLLRFNSMLVSLCVLPVFYALAARYNPRDAGLRTLQLFFMPLMFPFFFLIYTDMWALLAIGGTVLCTLQRRFMVAAIPASIALALRQDSVIWVGFAYLLTCFDGVQWADPARYRILLKNVFVRGLPLLVLFGLFLLFIYLNGGVAIGEKNVHKMGINITNFYVFLICAWFLFLPLNIQSVPRILALRHKPWIILAVILGLLVYMGTYSNTHPYNQANALGFLHNLLLNVMTNSKVLRGLLYIPAAWMLLTLLLMPWPDKRFYWLLLLIPLSIVSHPLIEQRYYYPVFAFLCVWRPATSRNMEVVILACYLPLAAFLLFGTVAGKFFL